jgi:outer membrane protein assembly factor BamB
MPQVQETFTLDDLAVWRTQLPDVRFAILPSHDTRPNPLAADETLFVSVFSPGAICALDCRNGRVIWRKEISMFAGSSVSLQEGTVFAKSSHTLYSLNSESGATLWSFSPYGTDGEWIYSSPTVHEGRVYIGDRRGFLHCLDAKTGKTIWKNRTNEAENGDVNSTPLISSGLVIVGTNANCIVAYEIATDKLAWKQEVDGPSILGPIFHEGSVVAAARSLYFLNPRSGAIDGHFSWKQKRLAFIEYTSDMVLVALTDETPPNGHLGLAFVNQSGIQRSARLDGYCLQFRYWGKNNLLYVSGLQGVDISDSATADTLCRITTDDSRGGVGLVDVKGGAIYALTERGCVYALRHPTISNSA